MPKNILKRIPVKKEDVRSSFSRQISEGERAFKDSQERSAPSQEEIKEDTSSPSALESLFQGGVFEYIFKSITGLDNKIDKIFEIEITESVDQIYRTGKLTIEDKRGFVEFSNIINTFEGESIEITLRNKFEENKGRVIKMGMYDMEDNPAGNSVSYNLYEEPYFTRLHKNVVNRSYSTVKATELIASIMAKDVGAKKIRLVEDATDPFFPSFILPNWEPLKCIQYLSQYCKQGPIKIFNISKEEDVITIITPLNLLMSGLVFTKQFDIVPSSSELTNGPFKLNNWYIYGVSHNDNINSLSGETVISFSYFRGDDLSDLTNTGTDDFLYKDNKKKSYGATVGGTFDKGVSQIVSKNLGAYALHKKNMKSTNQHRVSIDVEEKPLIEAKIQSRFRQSFHDELMLYTVLPGNSSVNIGQIFNITLPSQAQPQNINEPGGENTSMSGKWLLWKIIHKTEIVGNTLKYEMHCYFYRTGYAIAQDTRGADRI